MTKEDKSDFWPFPTGESTKAKMTAEKVKRDPVQSLRDWVIKGLDVAEKAVSKLEKPKEVKKSMNEDHIPTVTERASKLGVRFLHFNEDDVCCTIAYRPHNMDRMGKFLEVAVAYKHPNDQYSKKEGAKVAAERFLYENTLVVPFRGETYQETVMRLYNAFVTSTYY